jgi:hypothetical protein
VAARVKRSEGAAARGEREEEEKMCGARKFQFAVERHARALYKARSNRRVNFNAPDSTIAQGIEFTAWEILLLSHPKILECEINKIRTMFACLELKFHRELIFLIYLKSLIRKTI